MKKSFSTCDKTQAFESEIDQNQNYQTQPKITKVNKESETITNNQASFNSMESFCYQFFQDFFDKVNQTVTILELTKNYGVKNRRVYDLLGILEGFSFICKLKKKCTYMWLGIQTHHYNFCFEEKKSVALKDVAGLLKLLLHNCKQGLTIQQLNQKIIHKIEQNTKRQQCKKTITRRVYECLKVMKVFGMVIKQDNLFKLTTQRIKRPTNDLQCMTVQKDSTSKIDVKEARTVSLRSGPLKLKNIIVGFPKGSKQTLSL